MPNTTVNKILSFLPKHVSRDQAKDTGMALTLVCLLLGQFSHQQQYNIAALALLFLTMLWPGLFKPAAKLWFGLSQALGSVMIKLLLGLLFFLLVTPVGLVRRLAKKDALQLRQWKQGQASVFRVREHTFTAADIDHPY